VNTLEKLQEHLLNRTHLNNSPPVICKSGLTMSVQASETHYCSPKNNVGPYSRVEVGFPSRRVMALMPYRDWAPGRPARIFSYVPVTVVATVIEKNGGFA